MIIAIIIIIIPKSLCCVYFDPALGLNVDCFQRLGIYTHISRHFHKYTLSFIIYHTHTHTHTHTGVYGYLPPISQTIQIRRTKHKDEFISDVLFRTSTHRFA